MTKQDFLNKVMNSIVCAEKVSAIQTIYKNYFPDILAKLISFSDESVFFDDEWRSLSFDEIRDAEQDLHVSFSEKGLIPVLDCGENNFIVFQFSDSSWAKFNIIDEVLFKKKDKLSELFD